MLLFLKRLFCLAFETAPPGPCSRLWLLLLTLLLVSLKARPPDLRPLRPPRSSTPSPCTVSSIPRPAVPPVHQGSPGGASGKEAACQRRGHRRHGWVPSLGRKTPWRRNGQPTPVFLPGESRGQGSLAGLGPRGHKASDTTEALILNYSSSSGNCKLPQDILMCVW